MLRGSTSHILSGEPALEVTRHLEHELIARAVNLVSGKWKIAILSALSRGPLRYNALHRLLAVVSTKVLTEQLRGLAEDGLVTRAPGAASMKSFCYEITGDGIELWQRLRLLGQLEPAVSFLQSSIRPCEVGAML
jgi:DNA-binding HxlR family transcriptional regulator